MFERAFSQSQQFMAGWGKLWQEQLEELESAAEEAIKLQAHGAARTGQVIDELAKLGKASVEYSSRLAAEWSRVGLDAWRRSTELLTPPSPPAAPKS